MHCPVHAPRVAQAELAVARAHLRQMGASQDGEHVDEADFAAALEADEGFAIRLRATVESRLGSEESPRDGHLSARAIFGWLDKDGS